MVEGGELPGDFVGFVESGVDGPGKAQPIGNGSQRGQDGEGVRAADHVQVVDVPALLTQAQPLGQEEEVEAGPLRGTGHVGEGAEFDLAPRAGIAPDRGVVDAGEMGRQVDLLLWCHGSKNLLASRTQSSRPGGSR